MLWARRIGEIEATRRRVRGGHIGRLLLPLFGMAIVTVAVVVWLATFVGYTGSDDGAYLEAARGWVQNFPFVGKNWWSLRLTIVIPLAMSIRIFGENEYSFAFPTLIYQIGIASLAAAMVTRITGLAGAVAAALLILTLPLFAIASSTANADLPEVFYIGLSLWLFLLAAERGGSTRLLFGAGVAAGLAMLTRETALPLILVYGMLFLLGFGMPRKRYWIMAVAFGLVVGSEMLYYFLLSGDPLHRYRIDFVGAAVDDRPSVSGELFDRSGALRVAPLADPFVMLFGRISFGLLYYLAIPAVFWVWASRRERGINDHTARVMLLTSVVSFAFAALALRKLDLSPRYCSTTTFAIAIVFCLWFGGTFWPQHRRAATAALAVLVGTNLLGLILTNKDPMFGTRALVAYLSESNVPLVYVNPATAFRGGVLFEWAGQSSRLRSAVPHVGDLYFFDPMPFNSTWRKEDAGQRDLFLPQPNWQVVWRHQEEEGYIGRAVEWLGFDHFIPAPIFTKLTRPNPPVTIYRITISNN